jgi:hypothetical protein
VCKRSLNGDIERGKEGREREGLPFLFIIINPPSIACTCCCNSVSNQEKKAG